MSARVIVRGLVVIDLPDLERVEAHPKGWGLRRSRSARDPAMADRCEHAWAALERRSLHIVVNAANPAHFFASASATRTAVDEPRERRSVAGRLFSAIPIGDQHSTMIGGGAHHDGGLRPQDRA